MTDKASAGNSAKRPMVPEDGSDDVTHRVFKAPRRTQLPHGDDENDGISYGGGESTVDQDEAGITNKVTAAPFAGKNVTANVPGQRSDQPSSIELIGAGLEAFSASQRCFDSHVTQDNPKGVATTKTPTVAATPNTRAPSRPARLPPGSSSAPLGFLALDAYMNSDKLRFKVTSGESKVRVWCSLLEFLGYEDGARSFNEFVKSERFLRAGGSNEQQDRCRMAWKSFLLGNPADSIPYTVTAPLPNHLKRQPKKLVATQLVGEKWMVCLEVGTAVEVGPMQWTKDKGLLEACAAFCEEETDWASLYLY